MRESVLLLYGKSNKAVMGCHMRVIRLSEYLDYCCFYVRAPTAQSIPHARTGPRPITRLVGVTLHYIVDSCQPQWAMICGAVTILVHGRKVVDSFVTTILPRVPRYILEYLINLYMVAKPGTSI